MMQRFPSKRPQWLTLGLAFLLLLVGSGTAIAQGTTPIGKLISMSFKNEALGTILQHVSKQSGIKIVVTPEVDAYDKTYTVSFDQASAEQVVKTLLSGTPFDYTMQGRLIRVFPLKESATTDQYTVLGVVKDKNGETLPSATVRVMAEQKGQLTDIEGNFSFKVANKKGQVTISCVGFKNETLPYEAGVPLEVTLLEDIETLGEVTVIAYGTRNTRELTGAVSSVKAEQLQDLPNPSIETLLQGQMPGVQVTNISGTPGGGGSQVIIRGYSSLNTNDMNDGTPLYVIDGVPVYATTSINTGGINTLAGLDPSTIESVEVLKDAASASLYGSRAANGVILITTKKGKSGRTQFSANVSQSFSWLPETPTQMQGHAERLFHLKLAKNYRKAQYDWQTDELVTPNSFEDSYGWDPNFGGAYDYLWGNGVLRDSDQGVPAIALDSLNTFYNNSTNWWDYIFRTGYVTDADVMASGGTDNISYMLNGSFYDETGIMIGSSFRRFSFMNNLDIKLLPGLDLYSRLALSYTSKNAGSDMGKVQGLTVDPKLTSTLLPGKGTEIEKITLQRLQDVVVDNANYNIRLNVGARYSPIKSLTLNSSAAINHFNTRVHTFTPSYLMWDKLSSVRSSNVAITMAQTEHILNYQNTFGNHELDLMAGFTYNYELLTNINGSAKGGPSNQIHHVGTGWPNTKKQGDEVKAMKDFGTDYQEQSMVSYLGRLTYNYKKKYMLDLSLRRDSSSVFGSAVRWGTFPAAGMAWAFTEEPFAKEWWWLSFGKLRASWGRSGQKFQDAYLAHGTMQESNVVFGETGLIPGVLANNMLSWEKSDQYNFGLDLDLLDYRLKVGLDYYYKYSYDLLIQTPTPGDVYYIDKMWNNSSAISNEGIELSLKADVIRNDQFSWQMMFNISRNWNLFRESYDGHDFNEMVLGRPMNGLYVYKDEGIIERPEDIPYSYNANGSKRPLLLGGEHFPIGIGARKIKDQNGDGNINEQDLYYAGTSIPKAYGGWSNQLKWNGFTLFLHANFTLGRQVMNMVKGTAFSFTKDFGTIMGDYTKCKFWEKPGDNADYPSLKYADKGYQGQFDGLIDSNIENVSFIRLKQATLSYDLPKAWLERIRLKGLRIFVSGENLLLLTNYSGLDPEIIDTYSGKDDGTYYPLSRKVTVGLNLSF